MIQDQYPEHAELLRGVTDNLTGNKNHTCIHQGQKNLERYYGSQVVPELVMIPGNSPVVEVIDTQIQQDIQDKCKIEKREVETVHLFTYPVLYPYLDSEKPEGFDQEVQEDQKSQVGDEALFQTGLKIFFN